MKALITAVAFLLLHNAIQAQTEVKFCELLRNPKQYDGQLIKVRATLRFGFEWNDLLCLSCPDKGGAWLDTSLDSENFDDLDKAWKRMPKGAGIVNLTVVGVLHFGSTYGHLNGYRYEFQRSSRVLLS